MAKMFQVYGIGQAIISVLPPPLPFKMHQRAIKLTMRLVK